MMDIFEAEHILNQNGFLMESSIKGDFAKNETGGNKFYISCQPFMVKK